MLQTNKLFTYSSQDGQLCCSYDYGCAVDLGIKQYTITPRKPDSSSMPSDTSFTGEDFTSPKTAISTIGPTTMPASSIPDDSTMHSRIIELNEPTRHLMQPDTTLSSSTTSSKTFAGKPSRNDATEIDSLERSRSIAKNLVSFSKTQSLHSRGQSRTLVALSTNNKDGRRSPSLSMIKRGSINRSYLATASRLVGSNDAT